MATDNSNSKNMGNPASNYCSSLKNVKYHIALEMSEGVSQIIVFDDDKWDDEWNLFRSNGKIGKHLWLVDIEKSLLNSSRSLRFNDHDQVSILKSKCNEIHGDFAFINSGYVSNAFPYDKRGAVCILNDKTIIHASILIEPDWENQINALKASILGT